MNKKNVRIKDIITISDKADMIENIVSSYFTNDKYTPYFAEVAKVDSIIEYLVEGVEFEEGESHYNAIMNDQELVAIVNYFKCGEGKPILDYIDEMVADKVNFIKQSIIHGHDDMNKIIEFCNVVIDSFENFSKLDFNQMTNEDMKNGLEIMKKLSDKEFTTDTLSEVIKDAVGFNMDKATAEIIDAKNAEIRDLKKKINDSGKIVSMKA